MRTAFYGYSGVGYGYEKVGDTTGVGYGPPVVGVGVAAGMTVPAGAVTVAVGVLIDGVARVGVCVGVGKGVGDSASMVPSSLRRTIVVKGLFE
jgi:hypothetical protein